jgi:hypothetical protein
MAFAKPIRIAIDTRATLNNGAFGYRGIASLMNSAAPNIGAAGCLVESFRAPDRIQN